MKNIALILFILISMGIYSTPENGDIIDNPLTFSEWDSCFILKKNKKDLEHFRKVENGEEIKKLMKLQNLNQIYFRDCRGEKKWRKITRK